MKIAVFGAHPDDMEIGMGGTIAKHVSTGDEVMMILATVPSNAETRCHEAVKGAAILGATLRFLDLPAENLQYNRQVVRAVDQALEEISPDLVYTHWDHDSHQDHNVISRAVISATRKNRCSVLMYEQTIPGGIVPDRFKAQSFVDISRFIERKDSEHPRARIAARREQRRAVAAGSARAGDVPRPSDQRRVRGGLRGHQGDRGPLPAPLTGRSLAGHARATKKPPTLSGSEARSARSTGLEPVTSGVTGRRSNQLN